ncbi:alpha/beta hydrolase [Sphingorhabdus sp. Alg239-R122]|uniref:alpha/beta hydrolase n=1 Tax=Sphingorhabdus sp. Alg239-R122 TaxID=2305989 RepID=UPI0031F60249
MGREDVTEPGTDMETFDRRAIPQGASESYWEAQDGWKIRRFDWPAELPDDSIARGSMLFMAGRGDLYEKYLETFAHFHKAGWNITASDWRGQAGSGRMTDSQYIGHIEDFSVWIDDIRFFFEQWKASTPGPHAIMAHSMGGHLIARALIEKAVDPDAAILIAPMLGMRGLNLPLPIGHFLTRIMKWIGNPKRPAWKVSEKPASPLEIRQSLLTNDDDRYADELFWWGKRPELVMGPASWNWVERAYASARHIRTKRQWESVDTPVYIVATSADELVRHRNIEEAVERMPKAEMLEFGEEAAHEILREVDAIRDRALAGIDVFLDRATAPE